MGPPPRPRPRPRPPHLPTLTASRACRRPPPAPPAPARAVRAPPARAVGPRERTPTRSGADRRSGRCGPGAARCYGAETMRASSGARHRLSGWGVLPGPRKGRGPPRSASSSGPGPCAAASGLRDDAPRTPPPPGPWRRLALRTQTCRGLVTMATAAQAGSPRSVYSKDKTRFERVPDVEAIRAGPEKRRKTSFPGTKGALEHSQLYECLCKGLSVPVLLRNRDLPPKLCSD